VLYNYVDNTDMTNNEAQRAISRGSSRSRNGNDEEEDNEETDQASQATANLFVRHHDAQRARGEERAVTLQAGQGYAQDLYCVYDRGVLVEKSPKYENDGGFGGAFHPCMDALIRLALGIVRSETDQTATGQRLYVRLFTAAIQRLIAPTVPIR
jgi:hypothetical protein